MESPIVCDEVIAELLDVLLTRRDRFAVTAAVFSRETPEEGVCQMVAQATVDQDGIDDELEHALAIDLAALAHDDMTAFATQTRTEYARLFLGPREVVAPLHESAYLSGTARMFTAETLAVRKIYETNGYIMKAKNREPEDAIGTELEFMRNLCDQAGALLSRDALTREGLDRVSHLLEVLHDFRDEHLSRWTHLFVERVATHDVSGFYRAWARYLSKMLDEDDGLQDLCEESVAVLRPLLICEDGRSKERE